MRIYKMTATFGKLNHDTLTLEPGLNIITAPNEWGKSTWCAFLTAMLYGVDTQAKTTKTALADKDRYAPWSGEPMSGRIDLSWDGRDITIERVSVGQTPLGAFRAYETASGAPVPELNAENCGQKLLGVEQSVFCRSGFIRLADLPVTQDETMRRRLNALMTTGDDNAAAEKLADSLKELRSRCRNNRTGLLPQAESERDQLQKKIAELEALDAESKKVTGQLEQLRSMLRQLDNHRQAMAYKKAQEDAERVAQAKLHCEQALQERNQWLASIRGLPRPEEADQKLQELRSFREDWNQLQKESTELPPEPKLPKLTVPFEGMTVEEAQVMSDRDAWTFQEAERSGLHKLLITVGLIGLAAGAGLAWLKANLFAGIAGGASLLALGWGVIEALSRNKTLKTLRDKYGSPNTARWKDPITEYSTAMLTYEKDIQDYKALTDDLEVRLVVLRNRQEKLCGEQDPNEALDYWRQTSFTWQSYREAERAYQKARRYYDDLAAMVKPVDPPKEPDHLSHSEEDTGRLLAECAQQQQKMQNRLGQYQGRMASLGDMGTLQEQLQGRKERIASLERTYLALTIAQAKLEEATAELKRRLAPGITENAKKYLERMTGGRYTHLIMRTDFSLETGAEGEKILRDSLWRSDGTIDQLYLSLRLAAAEELVPDAPLILDDALARFDDERMKAALRILKELSAQKQVIAFTCQSREQKTMIV